LQSELLDSLTTSFENHESFQVDCTTSRRFSLEQIRDFMRRRLSRISAEFTFGRYASVHSIAERLFRTCQPVTMSDLVCPNEHDVDRNRSPTANCQMIVFGRPGMSLQACMDDFTACVSSKCSTCDACLFRKTSFVQTPPVLVFDLGTSVPSLSPELSITCGTTRVHYTLKGVVYLDNEHFTSRVITSASMIWFHDGLLTGASLVYESRDISSISTDGAVMAFYTL
jgi:hypothetical protein